MLSGKVIKGINAGNVVFHHRTMQIIARQQTICWQWPFFLSLRDTGVSTLANAIMQDKGSTEANSSWTWDLCLGCAFLLGLIWTLDVDECSSGMGGLQDPSWRRPPRSAPPKRHPGGAALTEARGSDPTISFKSTVLIQKQTWRKALLPTKHCSALVWQPGHLCGCQQHHHCAWPTLEGESPSGLVQSLIAPSRHRQGWRLSHTPPAYSPLLGLTHTAPRATHTEHFWDHFRESQWMELTRLARSSCCPHCDHQTWSSSQTNI